VTGGAAGNEFVFQMLAPAEVESSTRCSSGPNETGQEQDRPTCPMLQHLGREYPRSTGIRGVHHTQLPELADPRPASW